MSAFQIRTRSVSMVASAEAMRYAASGGRRHNQRGERREVGIVSVDGT